jgi:cyclopropane-fatty-acyl-phospholipid synthase
LVPALAAARFGECELTLLDTILDRGIVPDVALRAGIRKLLRRRLAELNRGGSAARGVRELAWIETLRQSPLAVETRAANEQHYEVPAAFYRHVLGARLKYSSALYQNGTETLDQAEEAMLATTCERARLCDGQNVLELGCGWGSLTLYMAEHFPKSRFTAVSNSASQRRFIVERAADLGLPNVEVITADINTFAIDRKFDRVVSVEMFEHLRNYEELFRRIGTWLRDDGLLFFHVFVHRYASYPFESKNGDDWMGRHFFTGGQMPSRDLFNAFQQDLRSIERHDVNGMHYARTSEHWLENIDRRRAEVITLFDEVYGRGRGKVWFERWRIFFMACAELFAFDGGNEWHVAHYLFAPQGRANGVAK